MEGTTHAVHSTCKSRKIHLSDDQTVEYIQFQGTNFLLCCITTIELYYCAAGDPRPTGLLVFICKRCKGCIC